MERKFLINTAVTAWKEPPRARHQVAFALAENYEVVFVARNQWGPPGLSTRQIHDRLLLIEPSFPVDYRFRIRIPGINDWYQHWLFSQLKKKFGDHLVVNFDFTAHRLSSFFNPYIYYCNDECIGNSKYPNWFTDHYYRVSERKVIKNSLFSVATTPYLSNKLSRFNPNTYEIPLGANKVPDNQKFKTIAGEDPTTVCYMGDITLRQVSVELLNQIVDDERLHLVLVGPVEEAFRKRLRSPGKITFTGLIKGDRLMEVLAGIDVGLALYNTQIINPGASPNKLWQYLSVGKPVVISHMENLREKIFPARSIYVHHAGQPLNELIYKARDENSEEHFEERIEFARKNTWAMRMEEFLKKIDAHT